MNFEEFLLKYQKKKVVSFTESQVKKPLVSVCVQTYQHQDYILDCLNGIINQKVDFNYEILIGEDCSSDGTLKLCKEFAIKHKKIVTLFTHDRINNISINGAPSGRFNFLYNLYLANGKYIAICEGDDYWTDPLKLQKQVDFLEENEDYNICFHEVNLLINGNLQENRGVTYERYEEIKNFPIDIKVLLEKGNFIHTASVVFRNKDLERLPFEISKSPIGDYLLYIYLLKNGGFIKKLNETMGIYRIGSGIYSSLHKLTYQKNMLIYHSCILSFLENNEQKKIILEKQIKLIKKHFHNLKQVERPYKLASKLSFKQIFKIIFFKVKLKIK